MPHLILYRLCNLAVRCFDPRQKVNTGKCPWHCPPGILVTVDLLGKLNLFSSSLLSFKEKEKKTNEMRIYEKSEKSVNFTTTTCSFVSPCLRRTGPPKLLDASAFRLGSDLYYQWNSVDVCMSLYTLFRRAEGFSISTMDRSKHE